MDKQGRLTQFNQEQFHALEDELRSIPFSQRQSPAAAKTIRKVMRLAKVIVTRLAERELEPLPRGAVTKALRILPDLLRRWDWRKIRLFGAIALSSCLVFEEARLKELTKSVSYRRKRLIKAGLCALPPRE